MSASAGMSTGMSASAASTSAASTSAAGASAAGASAIVSDKFREEFTQYNDIHENLKAPLSQFNTSYGTLRTEINAAHRLLEGTIEESVIKKNAWEQLKPKLQGLTKEYTEIHDGITVNNGKLEELKIRIKAAIAAKTVAAAAAKADKDATAAQALADAKQAIQTQIELLNELKSTRQTAFDDIVKSKSTEVNHIVEIVIPTNLIDIKQRLQAEHISETTRELVEGIETSITKSIRDEFQRISTQFNAKHAFEIEAIDENITEWTYVMGGNDIQTMLLANASTVTQSSSTILNDFMSVVTALVNTELGKLDSAKADVEAAASRDLEIFQEEEARIKSQSRSASPPVPPTSARNGMNPRHARSVAAATAATPNPAFEENPPVLDPIENEDVESNPVTPRAQIRGPRENSLYVSHNKRNAPPIAYLVVVKRPRQGGGSKNHHIQKGGALPEGTEIYPIGVNSPVFIDVMAGLISPKDLLTVNPDDSDNRIIEEIKKSGPPVSENPGDIYDRIKDDLITDQNTSPLTIGLRAVYKVNITKLIRLLDNTLHTRGKHEDMYNKLWNFMEYRFGTFGVLKSLFGNHFSSLRENEIKQIVGWNKVDRDYTNENIAMLFDKFSIICPKNGIKNTFLTNDDPLTQKNLGSKKTGYNQFRLNWIILLAFHNLYIGKSNPPQVGELIETLYNAFLGWMANTNHKDTFKRMFNNELVRQTPKQAYSEEFVKQIKAIDGSDPTLQLLVKAIKDKLCELESARTDSTNQVIDVEHDDEIDDSIYVPSPSGSGSDIGSDIDSDSGSDIGSVSSRSTSSRSSLSSAGISPPPQGNPRPRFTRSQRTAAKTKQPDIEYSQTPGLASVGLKPRQPPPGPQGSGTFRRSYMNPRLHSPSSTGSVQGSALSSTSTDKSNSSIDGRPSIDGRHVLASFVATQPPVNKEFISASKQAVVPLLRLPTPDTDEDKKGNDSFQHRARQNIVPPSPGRWASRIVPHPPGQKQPSPPTSPRSPDYYIRSQRRPLSASSSGSSTNAYKGSAAGSFTDRTTRSRWNQVQPEEGIQIKGQVNPAWERSNALAADLTRQGRIRLPGTTIRNTGKVPKGGSHKKRTRKHKKHISRHPTRRRRIAKPTPPEGHKYTRKRPRT
jgi:hypothetical protein